VVLTKVLVVGEALRSLRNNIEPECKSHRIDSIPPGLSPSAIPRDIERAQVDAIIGPTRRITSQQSIPHWLGGRS
jgi:hypothetical protein